VVQAHREVTQKQQEYDVKRYQAHAVNDTETTSNTSIMYKKTTITVPDKALANEKQH